MAARRKNSRANLPKIEWFDHERTDIVDVRPNEDGEFVQVWSAPFGEADRRLLLAYQRTINGPARLTSLVHLDEGPWSLIETTGPRRTFHYRDSRDYRYEALLPSGRILVDDRRSGLIISDVWSTDFDWENMRPTGTTLGPRSFAARRSQELSYFCSTYQEQWVEDQLSSKELVLVKEFQGDRQLNRNECPGPEGGRT